MAHSAISANCLFTVNWNLRFLDSSLSRFANICAGAMSSFVDSLNPVSLDILVSDFAQIDVFEDFRFSGLAENSLSNFPDFCPDRFLNMSVFLDLLEIVFLDVQVLPKFMFEDFRFPGVAENCFSRFPDVVQIGF